MKKASLVAALLALMLSVQAQLITTKTSKNVSVAFDVYTDILTKPAAGIEARAINQGFSFSTSYNFKVGESKHIFSLGAGIRTHNIYHGSRLVDARTDTLVFAPIDDKLNYKKSKLGLVYVDFPAEFKLKFKDDWKLGLGFKVGVLLDSKVKYSGQTVEGGPYRLIQEKRLNSLEKYTFGPTLRFGYKWINVYGFYQISNAFKRGLGPDVYPLSLGLTITPY